MAASAENAKYTYADLLTWPENERYELIDGVPRLMSAPSDSHQAASAELLTQFRTVLRGKTCFVRSAPYDVMLFASKDDRPEDIDTVLQPDIVVVCDRSRRTNHGCMGAPDLAIEILSPSTASYDRAIKLDLYEAAGVREYWILNVDKKKLEVYYSENGVFRRGRCIMGLQRSGFLFWRISPSTWRPYTIQSIESGPILDSHSLPALPLPAKMPPSLPTRTLIPGGDALFLALLLNTCMLSGWEAGGGGQAGCRIAAGTWGWSLFSTVF